jgi:antitoxin component YwqK of YwqJK toxin-antitoxin module
MGEVIRTYYESGQLKSEVFVVNNMRNGEYKQYWNNGQLYCILFYIDNMINGEYKQYLKNGHQRVHLVLPAVRRR